MTKKIKLEIKNRFTGKVLFSYEKEDNTISDTVLAAIRSRADLSGADLSGADLSRVDLRDADLSRVDLRDANLRDADLSGADLSRVDLRDANLRDADLSGADLRDANLRDANLSGAGLSGVDLRDADLSGADLSRVDLRDANLRDANLRDANLRDADLSGADLSRVDLRDANLRDAKEDLFSILKEAQNEINGIRTALVEGRINGNCYEGECACLVGTIANVRKCSYTNIPGIKPNATRPAERWFLAIRPGNTPENSQISKITLEWIDEFLGDVNYPLAKADGA